MGDAPGQLTHGLHLLALAELFLTPSEGRVRLFVFGEIAVAGEPAPEDPLLIEHRVAGVVDPANLSFAGEDPVFRVMGCPLRHLLEMSRRPVRIVAVDDVGKKMRTLGEITWSVARESVLPRVSNR